MRFLILLLLATLAVAKYPSVYLIRHAEKPSNKKNHHLSDKGKQRAECLRKIFSEDSDYDISYIMVEKRGKKARIRPFDTVAPLAKDLGVKIDDSCEQMDARCVQKAIKRYQGPGNILICWEHKGLDKIIRKLGVKGKHRFPLDSFNQIWSVHSPYSKIASVEYQNCPGLDHHHSHHSLGDHAPHDDQDDDHDDDLLFDEVMETGLVKIDEPSSEAAPEQDGLVEVLQEEL